MACDILIIGGGIAGLYCARELLKHNPNKTVLICEKYNELGGRMLTYHKDGVSWEKGAGRIAGTHVMLHGLLKEYGLHTIPIGSGLHFRQNGSAPFEENHFEPAIDVFLGPLRLLPQSILAVHTLKEVLVKVYGPQETQKWMDRFPYDAEVTVMRADMALREFFDEMNSHEGFSVCKEGMGSLIYEMEKDVKRRGGHIRYEYEATHVMKGQATFKTNDGEMVISAKKIVLAMPVNALKKVIRWKGLSYVTSAPLLRVYAKFDKPRFKGLGRVVTPLPIRYFLPISEEQGTAMVSYTDNSFAKHYMNMKSDKRQETIMRDLRELFPEKNIGEPSVFKSYPWYDGVTYWVPGNYEPADVSTDALNPIPGIYICGESFSLRQGWIEGSLEHTAALLKRHLL
jgi:phytoene dehydrogenase-like protein